VRRIAFDLDETLGVPLIDGPNVVGWQMRPGCPALLDRLKPEFDLVLWSVSPRRYVDKMLSFGLGRWFTESHSWDEVPTQWKDVRHLRVDFLIDDSPHHRQAAERLGLAAAYIVVPAYGSREDVADPLAWVRLVEAAVASHRSASCAGPCSI
jgi:NLI interacting factor-like phosphatase